MKILPMLALLLCVTAAQAADLPGIPAFIDEMVAKHQFKREELARAFRRADYRPDVIESISKPATLKPWSEYRANFINPERIEGGVRFWKKHAAALQRAERQYGVPQEYIVGIIGVETLYGKNMGKYRALDALTTLAFAYPRRADFFRLELEQYLLLAREQDFNVLGVQSSYAGALGMPQFMPGNLRKYGVDFNGNGKIDIMREPEDAIGSVANYFRHYGWRSGEPVALEAQVADDKRLGNPVETRPVLAWKVDACVTPLTPLDGQQPPAWLLDLTLEKGKQYWLAFGNFDVIMRYNTSSFYAMSVHQLAQAVKAARPQYQ